MGTRKTVRGGLCLAVNNSWATNYTVRESDSCRHDELLTVLKTLLSAPRIYTNNNNTGICSWTWLPPGGRPHRRFLSQRCHLNRWTAGVPARRFQQVWHHHCGAKSGTICDIPHQIWQDVRSLLWKHTKCIYFQSPPTLWSFRSQCHPPTSEVQTKTENRQNTDKNHQNMGQLYWGTQGLYRTDWHVFLKSNVSDLNQLTDSISSYLTFCADSVIPSNIFVFYKEVQNL